MVRVIAAESVPDAGAYCARLVRLDPAALVRLRPAGGGLVALWSRLPFAVLVGRSVRSELADDATVRAADLLAALPDGALPARYDARWRGALPPAAAEPVEQVPAPELRRIAELAATTLRDSTGRGVGERRVRDALLDHPGITLASGTVRAGVPMRVVLALVRMGFLADEPVRFGISGRWLSAQARNGTAWYQRPGGLTLDPVNHGEITRSDG
ncbi:hypothetical protein Athai_19450 [Actinocatenispora thailandica]|uniref:Uncharacterized protein n=1 Tax=Actinocatenispora thailandica TaxID=227318 RepID=A0A7R7DN62_9ACTN|nr:hypothetical protein [Actinocatenispora thailandica]BCJ34442.1 hypothetical protein Athai_19450 [Actinocatenispora thailandica]